MLRLPLVLILILSSTMAWGRERPFEEEGYANPNVQEPEYWKETGEDLPPFPQAEDLLEYDVDLPDTRFVYSVDKSSISVGEDEVVRYTLVIHNERGAWNVSREGMRCGTREYKVYAYGSKRSGFKALKNPSWQSLRQNHLDQHLLDLRQFYFCHPNQHVPYTVEEIVRRLRNPPMRNDDSGFL